jgi:hypothetical protein
MFEDFCSLLLLLQLVMEDNSKAFDSFIVPTISLCLDRIYPLLFTAQVGAVPVSSRIQHFVLKTAAEDFLFFFFCFQFASAAEARPAFHTLAFTVLSNKWRYFFPTPNSTANLGLFSSLLQV